MRFVRVKKFAELTGYTEKAVYHKCADGVWIEGREWRRAPDGNIVIDVEAYELWVQGQSNPGASRSGLSSPVTDAATARPLPLHPHPATSGRPLGTWVE